jgi:hypothetical protein
MSDADVIALLISHETSLHNLYAAYAEKFPVYSKFWNSMSAEERGHAKLIGTLKSLAAAGSLKIDQSRFKTELIKTMLNYINKEKDSISFGGLSLIQALTVAREIERSMIERRFFEVFKGDQTQLKKVLNTLEKDTREHLDKINIAWQENRINT